MFKIIAVTNSALCKGNFLEQLKLVAKSGVDSIILREKQLSEEQYGQVAKELINICRDSTAHCTLHYFADIAQKLKVSRLHLPLYILEDSPKLQSKFDVIGVSVHSADEAICAQKLGASYLSAGHVFETDCKQGLEPRGVGFLSEVCSAVNIPVFAIGGISDKNIAQVRDAGAAGACVMSGFMNDNAKELVNLLRTKLL